MKTNTTVRKGITLVEVLVVISIISVLIGLLLPAVQAAREAARRTQCQNNLRQLGLALASFESANKYIPAGSYVSPGNGPGGYKKSTWFVPILPYLEQSAMFNRYDFEKDYSDVSLAEITTKRLSFMACPSDVGPSHKTLASGVNAGVHSYFPCAGIDKNLVIKLSTPDPVTSVAEIKPGEYQTAFWIEASREAKLSDFTDGLSNTILIGEVHGLGNQGRVHGAHIDPYPYISGCSYEPESVLILHGVKTDGTYPGKYWGVTNGSGLDGEYFSYHPGRINHFLFGDGSVRALSADNTPIHVLVKLLSINDGQSVEY